MEGHHSSSTGLNLSNHGKSWNLKVQKDYEPCLNFILWLHVLVSSIYCYKKLGFKLSEKSDILFRK